MFTEWIKGRKKEKRGLMFPIWIKDGKTAQPSDKIFYELTANGLFLNKTSRFWRAVVPVEKISILQEEKPSIELFLPPIPEELTHQIARFFAWVYKERATEAVVLVWFCESEGAYRLSAPPQEVSPGSASYEIPNRRPGEVLIGTFHSHGGGSAFHSNTDVCDERSIDGIHGTFGSFSRWYESHEFSLSIQAVVNGTRFPLSPTDWLKGTAPPEEPKKEDVEKQELWSWSRVPKAPRFILIGQDALLPPDWQPPQEWKDNVKAKTWTQRYSAYGETPSALIYGSEVKKPDAGTDKGGS